MATTDLLEHHRGLLSRYHKPLNSERSSKAWDTCPMTDESVPDLKQLKLSELFGLYRTIQF